MPGDCEHPQKESSVANAVHDERLVGRVAGRFPVEVKADQQIRAQTDALPSDKQLGVVVPQNQRQHGEHEEVEVPEESVIPPLMFSMLTLILGNNYAQLFVGW